MFVLGGQKSGTTAIAALLAELTDRKLTSDFTHEDAADYRTRVFDRDIPFADLVRRHKRQFGGEIVKDPNLSFFLDELRSAFPAARLVFISRDPREQVRSLLDWMGLPGDRDEVDVVSKPALAHHENRRMLLEGRWPRVEGRNYVERLAARWRVAGSSSSRGATTSS